MTTLEAATADGEPWSPAKALGAGMLTVFSGQSIAYVITFASLPLLATIYTPADFAALGVFSGVIAVVAATSSLCYDKIVPLVRSDRTAAATVGLCLLMSACFSVCSWLVTAPVLAWSAESLRLDWLEPLGPLLALSIFAIGSQQAFQSWSVRRQDFKALSATRVVVCSVRVVLQVSLGLLWPGAMGLLLGFAAGNLTGAILAAAFCAPYWRQMRRVRFSLVRVLLHRYRNFPLFAAIPEVVQRLSVHLPALLLAVAYDYEVAGLYVLVQRLFGAPETLLQQSVSRVYLGVGAGEIARHPERIAQLFRFTFRQLLGYTAAPYLAVMLLAPWIFRFCFADAWGAAGIFCSILAPMYFVRLLYGSLRPTIDLLERPQLHTLGSMIVTASLTFGILLPYGLAWSSTAAIVSLSWFVFTGQALALYATWRAIPQFQLGSAQPLAKAA